MVLRSSVPAAAAGSGGGSGNDAAGAPAPSAWLLASLDAYVADTFLPQVSGRGAWGAWGVGRGAWRVRHVWRDSRGWCALRGVATQTPLSGVGGPSRSLHSDARGRGRLPPRDSLHSEQPAGRRRAGTTFRPRPRGACCRARRAVRSRGRGGGHGLGARHSLRQLQDAERCEARAAQVRTGRVCMCLKWGWGAPTKRLLAKPRATIHPTQASWTRSWGVCWRRLRPR